MAGKEEFLISLGFVSSGLKLGIALKSQGKVKDAKKIFKEVYDERKELNGEEDEDTIEAYALFASIWCPSLPPLPSPVSPHC